MNVFQYDKMRSDIDAYFKAARVGQGNWADFLRESTSKAAVLLERIL
jgi:hypothetical protein